MEVVTEITNVEFGKMINAAASALQQDAEKINKLNVFPVPDGDTGTNMTLSMVSGADYERAEEDTNLGSLARATSKGLLMGARGNSGVILSQIFRGFAKSVADKQTLSARDFADALMLGAQTAYKAVMKPTEGTILTVIREAASAANQMAKESTNVVEVAKAAYDAAEAALQTTPDLLPVLKEVGVVDSGGQGLVIVLGAFYAALSGQAIADNEVDNAGLEAMIQSLHNAGVQGDLDPADIKYGYCTEIMVDLAQGTTYDRPFDYDTFYNHLAELGDSLLVINDDEVVKVHVHTENPGEVLSWGTHFGSLHKVKVDNMRNQQVEAAKAADEARAKASQGVQRPEAKLAVITVAAGAGMQELFYQAGATVVLDGEQAPSTQDLVAAVKSTGAERAIILPNDGNIFMAAEQALQLTEIPTAVVPTKTVQQGMTAMVVGYNPEGELATTVRAMTDASADVVSGAVTVSVRDTTLNGLVIRQGDAIGLLNQAIVVAEPAGDILAAANALVAKMLDDEAELLTIYYGNQADAQLAEAVKEAALTHDDELEVEVYDGGQALYPLLLSVE